MPLVTITSPDGTRREHRFDERVVLGRDPGCDVTLDDPRVSSHHAVLVCDPCGHAFIRDLGSTNGVIVEGHRARVHWLEERARILLGDTRLVFVQEPGDPGSWRRAEPGAALSTDTFPLAGDATPELYGPLLRSVHQLSTILEPVQSRGELVRALAQHMVWVTGAVGVAVLLLDRRGRLEPHYHLPGGLVAGLAVPPAILEAARADGEPLLVPARRLFRGDGASSRGGGGERLVLCAPLLGSERLHGMLLSSHMDPGRSFSDLDVRLAGSAGLVGGLALDDLRSRAASPGLFHRAVEAVVDELERPRSGGRGRSRRVGAIASAIAVELGLPAGDHGDLRIAALLHDLGLWCGEEGSTHLDDGLLAPLGRGFRDHPRRGAELLAGLDGLARVRAAVLHHHERWDGQGFPEGLAGEDIPRWSRIIAVADAVAAMSPGADALRALRAQAGERFDPAVVRVIEGALCQLVEPQPIDPSPPSISM